MKTSLIICLTLCLLSQTFCDPVECSFASPLQGILLDPSTIIETEYFDGHYINHYLCLDTMGFIESTTLCQSNEYDWCYEHHMPYGSGYSHGYSSPNDTAYYVWYNNIFTNYLGEKFCEDYYDLGEVYNRCTPVIELRMLNEGEDLDSNEKRFNLEKKNTSRRFLVFTNRVNAVSATPEDKMTETEKKQLQNYKRVVDEAKDRLKKINTRLLEIQEERRRLRVLSVDETTPAKQNLK
jgi:hypothetical protein